MLIEEVKLKIGNTPLLRLKEIEDRFNLNNEIFIKDESKNYTGSIKDRPALNMILNYINDGLINESTTIIEATSGNMGISLAALCESFNLPCIIVMPKSMSKQRQEMIKQYHAKLLLVDGTMEDAKKEVEKLAKENKNYLIFNQFNNKHNPSAHYFNTAREIENQLNDIDYMFICFGSSGTITGISTYYKEKGYKTKFIAIEPEESPLLSKGYASKHIIQGIGANFIPSILNKENIFEVITVNGDKAKEMAKLINQNTSLFVGISTGANVLGIINYIKKHNLKNKKILTLVMDKGDRYSWGN